MDERPQGTRSRSAGSRGAARCEPRCYRGSPLPGAQREARWACALSSLRAQLRSRYWQMSRRKDALAGTGLRDASSRCLGTSVELRLLWDASSWLQVGAGVADWVQSSCFDSVPGAPSTDDTLYGYAAAHQRL